MSDIIKARSGLTLSKFMPFQYFRYFIEHESLSLVNPELWQDKNDSGAIQIYKEKAGIKHLFATCLTRTSETSHHWSVYGEDGGVRIVFNKEVLLRELKEKDGYICGDIEYIRLKDFSDKVTDISRIPFVKRWAYRDEREFRIIWTGIEHKEKLKLLKLPKGCVNRVIFESSISGEMLRNVRSEIYKKFGKEVKVSTSSYKNSKGWLDRISSVPAPLSK